MKRNHFSQNYKYLELSWNGVCCGENSVFEKIVTFMIFALRFKHTRFDHCHTFSLRLFKPAMIHEKGSEDSRIRMQ